MIDDIFNSPTVVIRQRTDGFNRKLAPPPTQACATPDRKAFSDITNLRPMATPEFHKGKTSILPYRGSTPITPGIEHLFLSDLDNTASPQSEQGTINGFSCDMTTDCSANDSVGSPEQCKGSHSQEATPTSDRRTSIYTKIMTEAVFSLPRSPAKTAEDGDDSHRSLADTSERSINAELKRNTLRLTHLDSDSECGDGDISANSS
ncbi:hypothetical protein T484DRAFT_1877110 [Baffinella frigidus]|nr:hypothetical protein T484DRAFT_1877110 [Cryptophyta sp. CCMP2293]